MTAINPPGKAYPFIIAKGNVARCNARDSESNGECRSRIGFALPRNAIGKNADFDLREAVALARYRERLNSDHRRLRNEGATTRTSTRDHYAKHDELEE